MSVSHSTSACGCYKSTTVVASTGFEHSPLMVISETVKKRNTIQIQYKSNFNHSHFVSKPFAPFFLHRTLIFLGALSCKMKASVDEIFSDTKMMAKTS